MFDPFDRWWKVRWLLLLFLFALFLWGVTLVCLRFLLLNLLFFLAFFGLGLRHRITKIVNVDDRWISCLLENRVVNRFTEMKGHLKIFG